MSKIADEPAFPDPMRGTPQSVRNQEPEKQSTGMTMRQYYAGQAMVGYLASYLRNEVADPEQVAKHAVKCADAIIAELSKTKP